MGFYLPTLSQDLSTRLKAKNPIYCGVPHHTDAPFAQDYDICSSVDRENSLHCGHSNNEDLSEAIDFLATENLINADLVQGLRDILTRSQEIKFYLIDAFPMILKHVIHYQDPSDLQELDSLKIPVLPENNSVEDLSNNLKKYALKLQQSFGPFSIALNNLLIALLEKAKMNKTKAQSVVQSFIERWDRRFRPVERLSNAVKNSQLFDKISEY